MQKRTRFIIELHCLILCGTQSYLPAFNYEFLVRKLLDESPTNFSKKDIMVYREGINV